MQKYIHTVENFPAFFQKCAYAIEENGAIFSAILFESKNKKKIVEFRNFLLKYLRITDDVFALSQNQTLVILEETTIKGTINFSKDLRERIKTKKLAYKYYCSAIQLDYIETEKKLCKSLRKRLEIAKKRDTKKCISQL